MKYELLSAVSMLILLGTSNSFAQSLSGAVADGETVELTSDHRLTLKNRVSESKINYIMLRKSDDAVAKITAANTIYEICYDYDLKGRTLKVPAGSSLLFNGGSFRRGKLDCSGCTVTNGHGGTVFGSDLTVSGLALGYAGWFGAYGDGKHNDLSAIQRALNACDELVFRAGEYLCEGELSTKYGSYVHGEEGAVLVSPSVNLAPRTRFESMSLKVAQSTKTQYAFEIGKIAFQSGQAPHSAGTQIIIDRIYVKSFTTNAGYAVVKFEPGLKLNHIYDVRVSNITVDGPTGIGFHIVHDYSGNSPYDVWLTDVVFKDCWLAIPCYMALFEAKGSDKIKANQIQPTNLNVVFDNVLGEYSANRSVNSIRVKTQAKLEVRNSFLIDSPTVVTAPDKEKAIYSFDTSEWKSKKSGLNLVGSGLSAAIHSKGENNILYVGGLSSMVDYGNFLNSDIFGRSTLLYGGLKSGETPDLKKLSSNPYSMLFLENEKQLSSVLFGGIGSAPAISFKPSAERDSGNLYSLAFNGDRLIYNIDSSSGTKKSGFVMSQTFMPYANSKAQLPENPCIGSMVYYVPLKKPIWWSGSSWNDAMGTKVF